ncbi:MAG: 50S ribosomal protein L33 [Bacteroidota bacterium]
MAKSKDVRHKIILECTEAPGTSRYSTMKNRRNTTGRLELRKYNPVLKKHTIHREIK